MCAVGLRSLTVVCVSPALPTFNDMDDSYRLSVSSARASMIAKRIAADAAASEYRAAVRAAVEHYKASGLSLRKSADRIGISEGALRDLLRPEGSPRRSPKRKSLGGDEVANS